MADHRHKRDANARRKPRAAFVAAPIAVLATAGAVTLGVSAAPSTDLLTATAHQASVPGPSMEFERQPIVSRSSDRIEREPTEAELMMAPEATRRAVREADEKRWTTEALNLWSEPGEDATKVGLLDELTKVLVTGRSLWGREEVVVEGRSRWVSTGYLVAEKPVVETVETAGESAVAKPAVGGSCTNGTSVSAGVSPNIVAVHQAVCAAFPQITSYGDFRSDGEHSQGIALDIMVSGDLGWQVAELLRANYAELGVSYLIYSQQIWSVERSSEGWRPMEDRGSVTANHYDHVHVTTY